jgi:hypothetical protein
MGCDMHCVVEVLNKKTRNWECFGVSTGDRNYSLFSRIADVRNSEKEDTYIEPIDVPRGWPGDVSSPAEAWHDMFSFTHSATWLNRTELESLDKWVQGQGWKSLWKILGFDHLSYLFSLGNSWKKAAFTRYSDLRVLFFFDN